MRLIKIHSTGPYTLRLMALPIALSGCGIITGECSWETRYVSVEGSVMDGGVEVAGATANLLGERGPPRLTFTWQLTAPSLEGHVTSAVLVSSTRPVPILLNLPIRKPKEPYEPWAYQYAYSGTMEQRPRDTTPLLGGIFEILAAGEGVLELTTDLPAQSQIRIPLAVTEQRGWRHGGCSS
jgi:hypothetical protein